MFLFFYFHDNFAKYIHESLQCIFYSDNVYFIQRFSVVFIPPYLAEILSTLKNGMHTGGLIAHKNQIKYSLGILKKIQNSQSVPTEVQT